MSPPPATQTTSLPSTPVGSHSTTRPTISNRNVLGTKPISSASFNSSVLNPTSTTTLNSSVPSLQPSPSNNLFSASTNGGSYSTPKYNLSMAQPLSQSNGVMQPSSMQYRGGLSQPIQPSQPTQNAFTTPNYNLSLSPNNPIPSFSTPPLQPSQPAPPPFFNAGMGVLAPSKPPQPTWGSTATNKQNNTDWGDFDPLG